MGPPRPPVCDGTQIFKRYRYRYFYPVPNIFDTDTGTFFGTKFSRYRFRDLFPILNFTDTGSETTRNRKNSRFRYLFGSGTHYKPSKFPNFGDENQFWYKIVTDHFFRYQIFSIPIPV